MIFRRAGRVLSSAAMRARSVRSRTDRPWMRESGWVIKLYGCARSDAARARAFEQAASAAGEQDIAAACHGPG